MTSFSSAMLIAVALGADLSADDALAVFQQNMAGVQTARVQWRLTKTHLEGYQRYFRQQLADLDSQPSPTSSNPSVDGENRARVARSAEAELPPPSHHRQEFWTDFDHFQARMPTGKHGDYWSVDQHEPSWLGFPNAALTPDSIGNNYVGFHIMSWGPATKGAFRVWFGDRRGGAWTGRITKSFGDGPALPPFLTLPAGLAVKKSLYQDFFAETSQPTVDRVLGKVQIDGRPTVTVLRWRVGQRFNEHFVAYLDISRGGVPLRIESLGLTKAMEDNPNWLLPTATTPNSKDVPAVNEVLHSVTVEEQDGVFYPSAGTFTRYVPLSLKEGGEVVPAQEEKWQVVSVAWNEPMRPETFALGFPPGTIIADDRSGDMFVTGDVGDTARRVTGGVRLGQNSFPWSLLTGLVVFGCGAGFLGYRRWRS